MIKRFKDINENNDNNLDPFNEEDWSEDEGFDLDKIDFRHITIPVTMWQVSLSYDETLIEFYLYNNDGNFYFNIKNPLELSDDLIKCIEDDYYDEILEILVKKARE